MPSLSPLAVNQERRLVSLSRGLFADLVFCGGYGGSISAANVKAQDGLIEPEKTHLRIRQNKATTRILPHGANSPSIRVSPLQQLTSAQPVRPHLLLYIPNNATSLRQSNVLWTCADVSEFAAWVPLSFLYRGSFPGPFSPMPDLFVSLAWKPRTFTLG